MIFIDLSKIQQVPILVVVVLLALAVLGTACKSVCPLNLYHLYILIGTVKIRKRDIKPRPIKIIGIKNVTSIITVNVKATKLVHVIKKWKAVPSNPKVAGIQIQGHDRKKTAVIIVDGIPTRIA